LRTVKESEKTLLSKQEQSIEEVQERIEPKQTMPISKADEYIRIRQDTTPEVVADFNQPSIFEETADICEEVAVTQITEQATPVP
jgi:hypothetical protein